MNTHTFFLLLRREKITLGVTASDIVVDSTELLPLTGIIPSFFFLEGKWEMYEAYT